MNLASYVDKLRGGRPYKEVAQEIGISNGNLHNIISGKTKHPPPDVLYKIARRYGQDAQSSKLMYGELMKLAGHLDWMPHNWESKSTTALTKSSLPPEIEQMTERLITFPNVEQIETIRSINSIIDLAESLQESKKAKNIARRDKEIKASMPPVAQEIFTRVQEIDQDDYDELMSYLSYLAQRKNTAKK